MDLHHSNVTSADIHGFSTKQNKVTDNFPSELNREHATASCSRDAIPPNNNNKSNSHQQMLGKRNGISNESYPDLQSRNKTKCIKIDGYIYDITNFIQYHPGGSLIEHFIDREASDVFHAFHEKDVLKYRTPVGCYSIKTADKYSEAFAKLHKFLIRNGFFKISYKWYAIKIGVTFSFLVVAFCLIARCQQWYLHYIGALPLALFWHQCGFFMHDFMHSHGTRDCKIDTWIGIFFSTVCMGINGRWWKEEHFVHHALTCCVDYKTNFCDPQMKEPIWAQNQKLFPFFGTYLESMAISIQHITFLPVCFIAGRIGVMMDSFKDERRPLEWLAFLIHWSYVLFILSHLSSWLEMFIVFFISNCFIGVLIIQLLLSHYSKPFHFKKDVCYDQNWYRMQIESNMNLVCPIWLDWFHGGLNFHIEHHLYPTMPRQHYREASYHVRRVCGELGMNYDECSLSRAIIRTLKHLKTTSKVYKLDPR